MLLQDIRYAWRSLTKTLGFTAIAVSCLSLGIGINTSIFSVVDGVLLKPYPYSEPDRLIVLNSVNQRVGVRRGGISYADFKDLREQTSTLSAVAAFTGRSLTISDGTSEPERYIGQTVSWNLFEVLGTPPVLGRNFGPEDDRPGAEPVVMLSHEVWQNRYNGDRSRRRARDLSQRSSAHGDRRDAAAIRIPRDHAPVGDARALRRKDRRGTPGTCKCSRG